MGQIVIVGYKPKPGKAAALRTLLKSHAARLRAEGLVTTREPILMEAANGTVIEVFEWISKAAIEASHKNAAVVFMWGEFAEVCDYVPVASVPEAGRLFSDFAPL